MTNQRETEGGEAFCDDLAISRRVLGLVPSPVYGEKVVHLIANDLGDALNRRSSNRTEWVIEVESDPLTGSNVRIDAMLDSTLSHRTHAGWDVAIALTDLPIREHGETIIAEGRSGERVALLSIPALGIFRLSNRVIDMICELVDQIENPPSDAHKPIDIQINAPRVVGTVQLLAGMVYANKPWTLIPSFRTTVATAFATGGYGLIFTTLWKIGNIYGYARLTTLMFLAMGILISWIIIAHQLWERPRNRVSTYQRVLYNATTVATIATGVVFAYAIVFILLLAAAVVYIPSSMLKATIETPVLPTSYVRIAWVTSSVATIAGAIGAGLEDSDAVRNATFGWRQAKRWKEYNENAEEDRSEKQN